MSATVPVMATPGPLAEVTVHFWAAAREAAGCSTRTLDASSIADVVRALSAGNERLAKVLALSSLLVDGARRAVDDSVALPPGSVVEVLPPFAGG